MTDMMEAGSWKPSIARSLEQLVKEGINGFHSGKNMDGLDGSTTVAIGTIADRVSRAQRVRDHSRQRFTTTEN